MTVHNLRSLFQPKSVVVLGAAVSSGQQQLLRNLAASVPPERRQLIGCEAAGWTSIPELGQLQAVELAVGFDERMLGREAIAGLIAVGCRALIWASDVPIEVARLALARSAGLRILGDRTPGALLASGGVNASAFELSPKPGRLAMIAQSRTIAAAALDWASGRGVGFSWLAVTGAEMDIDVADLLDYASLDPNTKAVVIQLSWIRGARKFMSAARALARVKPVAILQTRPAEQADSGPDPVRSAAFRRAGLIECQSLVGLFDAIAALELRQVHEGRVAVVGNGAGVCALGVDALRAEKLTPAEISAPTWESVRRRWPLVRDLHGALDLGSTDALDVVKVIAALLKSGSVDTVMLVHSPGPGESHEALVSALIESEFNTSVLTIWLGLATASAARSRCGEAAIPTFASPESAARALHYKRLHRQTQELLTRTPPAAEALADHRASITTLIEGFAVSNIAEVPQALAIEWLTVYEIGMAAPIDAGGWGIIAEVKRHPQMGTYLTIHADTPAQRKLESFALPPLDQLLAQRLLEEAGYQWPDADGADDCVHPMSCLAGALVRLSQFVLEQAQVATISLRLSADVTRGTCLISEVVLQVTHTAPAERQRLALACYPADLEHTTQLADGRLFHIRAVRPSDEPQLISMLQRTDPESIRLRYFGYLRYFSHAMAARLSQIDYDRELVLIAIPIGPGAEGAAAIAHLSIGPDGDEAEFAVLVHQGCAKLGLGRHMLLGLLDYAARRGVGRVHGEVLAENLLMLQLCKRIGFSIHRCPDDPGCMDLDIDPKTIQGSSPPV